MPENRIALIVASYEYEDPDLRRLVAPAQDAEALARVLADPAIGSFVVHTLLNQPAHRVNEEIEAFFTDRKRDDLVLLYFSGHGIKDESGQLYFATANTRRKRLLSTAVSANFVNDVMRSSRSRKQVLLLDCCYSGAFARGILAKADKDIGTKERFEGRGRVVLTASDAMQYSFEGDTVAGEGVRSVFTRVLVHGLETGEADLDRDGHVSLDELYEYVYDRVVDETPQQRPGKWVFDVQGDILIAQNPRLVELPAELRQAIESPIAGVREGAVRELDRLLHGSNAGLSIAAREALKRLAEDDSRRVATAATVALAPYVEVQHSGWIGYTIGRRYKIEALLGQGGMSAVYKGTDPNLRRPVAIKLIHPHLSSDPEFVRRFEQEASSVAKLRHPNILQVYDFDHEGDVYYMVLEYLAGETLHDKLKALRVVNQRLPRSETIRIIATVCDAASYAHQRGVVHRDLKPANVMLDPQGQVTLMDFGVAKMLGEPQHTTSGVVVGTVAYMSPEQVRGDALDGRADIYSLGVMLYELVAGRAPFEADSAISLMLKHLNEAVPDIRTFAVDIPEDLVRVIDKALQKNAADRFQTAAEMAAALRAIDVKTISDRAAQEAAIVEEASSLITQRVERAEDERLATEKAEAERLAREKEEQDRLAREAERIEAERLAAQKVEEERRAAETAEAERLAAQRAEKERLAADKAEADRIAREAAERLVAERLAAQKAEEERRAAEKAEAERLVREKEEQERLAREEAERLEAERLAAGQAEAERVAREKEEQDRLAREAERLAAKKAEEKRLADEKAEVQRLAREKSEQERLAREEAERLKAERLAAKKAEEKRLAAEKAEAQRLAREKSEQERLAREKAERLEAERLAAKKAEEKRLAAEKAEAQRLAREKSEQERLAREKAERLEAERLAAEKAEAERLARQRAEQERLARAQVEAERRAGEEHAQPAPLDKAQAAALPAARPTAKGRWPLLLLGAVVVVAIVGLIVALPKAGRQPLPSAAGMVKIAGGQYTIGDVADDNHAPQQQVGVGTFWLDKFAVTNAQYAEFLAKTKRQPPTSWDKGTFPAGKEDYPAEGITFDVASAYCSAVDKRLPTEAEWEVAARGPDHWLYPWGNDRDVVKLPRNPYPVGSIDANHSPFGIYDMAGSVWQWVANPYVQVPAGQRVMRGGSYDNFRDMAYRLSGDPNVPTMYATTGIRCAADQVAGE